MATVTTAAGGIASWIGSCVWAARGMESPVNEQGGAGTIVAVVTMAVVTVSQGIVLMGGTVCSPIWLGGLTALSCREGDSGKSGLSSLSTTDPREGGGGSHG